jgi:hypothetical protein
VAVYREPTVMCLVAHAGVLHSGDCPPTAVHRRIGQGPPSALHPILTNLQQNTPALAAPDERDVPESRTGCG